VRAVGSSVPAESERGVVRTGKHGLKRFAFLQTAGGLNAVLGLQGHQALLATSVPLRVGAVNLIGLDVKVHDQLVTDAVAIFFALGLSASTT